MEADALGGGGGSPRGRWLHLVWVPDFPLWQRERSPGWTVRSETARRPRLGSALAPLCQLASKKLLPADLPGFLAPGLCEPKVQSRVLGGLCLHTPHHTHEHTELQLALKTYSLSLRSVGRQVGPCSQPGIWPAPHHLPWPRTSRPPRASGCCCWPGRARPASRPQEDCGAPHRNGLFLEWGGGLPESRREQYLWGPE